MKLYNVFLKSKLPNITKLSFLVKVSVVTLLSANVEKSFVIKLSLVVEAPFKANLFFRDQNSVGP